MKTIILALLLLLAPLSTLSKANRAPIIPADPMPSPYPTPKPVIADGDDIFTYKCENCNASEKKKVPEMQSLLNQVVKDKCFDDAWHSFKRIEQATLNGKKLDADGIIASFRNRPIKDIPLFFYVPAWYQSKNVIGYTVSGSPTIYLNRNFRNSNSWSIFSEVSNELHETAHKIGYEHDFKATERRPYSVPYLSNRAVEFCEKVFNQRK